MSEVDWRALQDAAVEAMRHAYAPYSKFKVGVAGLVGLVGNRYKSLR